MKRVVFSRIDMNKTVERVYTEVVVKGGTVEITYSCERNEWSVSQPDHDQPIIGIGDTLLQALDMALDVLLIQEAEEQDEPPQTTRDRYTWGAS